MTSYLRCGYRLLVHAIPLLLMVLAVLILSGSAEADYDPEEPATWNWTIVGETVTYRNGTVLLDDNITVRAGGSLTLSNVTIIFNCSRWQEYGILVEDGGELIVDDWDRDPTTQYDASVISTRSPRLTYTWICEEGSTVLVRNSIIRDCAALDESGGILVRTGDASILDTSCINVLLNVRGENASLRLDNTSVRDFVIGMIVVGGSADITGCTFSNNQDIGIIINGSRHLSISTSTIRDQGQFGIWSENNNISIEDCLVTNCTTAGIYFWYNVSGMISGCTISESVFGIIVGSSSKVEIEDCHISITEYGIFTAFAEELRVLRTSFEDGIGSAIYCNGSAPIITECTFTSWTHGILFVNSEPFLVERCIFLDNQGTAIRLANETSGGNNGTVEDCTFRGNTRSGIWLEGESRCTIRNGTFVDNGNYAVRCDGDSSVTWNVEDISYAINETIALNGKVRVASGGNLSLINTTVVVADPFNEGPIDVSIGGDLWLLDGDGNASTPQDETQFIHTAPNPGLLYHHYVGGHGDIVARNVFFEGMTLFSSDGNLTVEECEFQRTRYGIYIFNYEQGSATIVSDCVFADSSFGIFVEKSPIQVTDCLFSRMDRGVLMWYCNGSSMEGVRFINCEIGVSIKGGNGISIQNLTTLGCGDGINSWDASDVTVTDSTIRQSSKHGIRLFNTHASLEDFEVTTSKSGGIVVDDSLLSLERCTIHSNDRAGLMGNFSHLTMSNTSVTATNGIGIWWKDDAPPPGEFSLYLTACFLDTGAAYDVRLEMSTLGIAYNTYLDPDDVRVLDDSLLVIQYDLNARVQVMGKESVPPTPVTYEVSDRDGSIVDLGTLTDPIHLPVLILPAHEITSIVTTTFIPYKVKVDVAGREWSNSSDLVIGSMTTVWVELALVPSIDVPELIHEGIEVTMDASGTVCYPFGLSSVDWDIDPDASPGADITNETIVWTFPSEGSYEVLVTTIDTVGNANSTTLQLLVVDSSALAEIITSVPDPINEDEEVLFEGRFISDVDEVIILEWDFGDGTKANGASTTHTWTRAGQYNVTFTVVEEDGSYSEAVLVVTVVNVAPTAVIKDVDLEVGKRERFDLDGSPSTDTPSDLGSLKYMWDMGGDPFLTGAQAFWRFEEVGVYTINLMVVDDDGAWDRTSMTVTVVNRPPTIGPIPDARLNATDPLWSHKLVVSDPDDDIENLTLSFPEFEPGGAFSSWVERDDDGGWTVYVRPREERDGRRADVEVTVRDPEGATASTTFTIDIDTSSVVSGVDSMWWVIIVMVMVLAVLSVGYMMHVRRTMRPPTPPEGGPPA